MGSVRASLKIQLRTTLIITSLLGACALALFPPQTNRDLASSNEETELKAAYRRPEQIPYPKANPFSEAKYQLGKRLFFDPRLSKSNLISCSSCHNPALSWTDGLSKSLGHGGKPVSRRAPTLLNVAWGRSFFWDGRARTLEEQALGPIQATGEMNTTLPELEKKVRAIAEYKDFFERAFPNEPITSSSIAKAIATFERSIVSDVAPFDSWIAGDETAISESAQRGFALFNTKAACVKCHNGWNFTNGSFADIGLASDDLGRGKILDDRDVDHAFKTPTLRNISRRGPFMHDGSLATLEQVIENYNSGGTVRRSTTKIFLSPLGLTESEKTDLISFLKALTSEDEGVIAPPLPQGEAKGDI